MRESASSGVDLAVHGRRSDLQGMRAIAVLAVFANHLFGWPSGGFVGVDVFFVLSGFFITGLLIRDRTNNRKLSFKYFYIRRVKRILPSALLVLIVTVIGSYLLFPAARAKSTLLDALYAAVFASNFRFQAVGADYFQQGQPPSPLQHYWSLSIEEQFYFVWPALLALIFTLTRRLVRKGKNSARHWGLFGAMSVLVTTSFGWAMFLSAHDPNSAYFSTFTRVWELGVGALVAIAGPWLASIRSSVRPTLAYLGLAGVFGSLFVIDPAVQFPAPWAALPVLSTALVVASYHGAEVRGMALLTNPVANYLGDTSYTLYLWHWPVITLLMTVLPKGLLFYALAVTLAFGLTVVTYRFYENPIRTSKWLLDLPPTEVQQRLTVSPPAWGLIGGVAATVIVVAISFIHYEDKISAGQELSAVAQSDTNANKPGSSPSGKKVDPCFGAPAMVTSGCPLLNPDVPVVFAQGEEGAAYECNRKKGEELKSCTYGYLGEDAVRIALVGDSHASALIPGLQPFLEQNKWKVTTFTGFGCRFDSSNDCPMYEVQAKLLAKPYDIVLLTASREFGGDMTALQNGLAPISSAGSRIVFVADNPAVSEESLACLTRVNTDARQLGDCGTPRAQALAKPDPMTKGANLIAGSVLIDMTEYYCNDDRCPSIIGNVAVFADKGAHLTETFARSLAQPIRDGLGKALVGSKKPPIPSGQDNPGPVSGGWSSTPSTTELPAPVPAPGSFPTGILTVPPQ